MTQKRITSVPDQVWRQAESDGAKIRNADGNCFWCDGRGVVLDFHDFVAIPCIWCVVDRDNDAVLAHAHRMQFGFDWPPKKFRKMMARAERKYAGRVWAPPTPDAGPTVPIDTADGHRPTRLL